MVDSEDLHAGEAHGAGAVVGGADVGAVLPRAAAAVEDDGLGARHARERLRERGDPLGLRGRTGKG